ncbi:MAG: epoxyqueuosine reductase [Clostridiales bacterium]|nr:epoxyqueuosine reductase [Clostridiales bacterium]
MDLREIITDILAQEIEKVNPPFPYRTPLIGYADALDPMFLELTKIVGNKQITPLELLPSAKTVIVYFIPFSEEMAVLSRKGGSIPIHQEWSDYYTITNILLANITNQIQFMLEALGFETAIQPPTNNYDDTLLTASWSHKSCAVIAGLGTFGLNHLLITKSGTMGRLGSLVTSAVIPATKRPSTEYCLYYKNGGCKFCVENCPSGALCVTGLDKFRCDAYLYGKNIRDNQQGCPGCSSGPCAFKGFE